MEPTHKIRDDDTLLAKQNNELDFLFVSRPMNDWIKQSVQIN